MGYEIRDPEPRLMKLAGVDLTILRDNLEHRFDIYAGTWLDEEYLCRVIPVRDQPGPGGALQDRGPAELLKFGEEYDYEAALCFFDPAHR